MNLRLIYKEKVGKRSKSAYHYQLENGNTKGLLSDYIRISINRGFAAYSQPDFWLHEHDGHKFRTKATSGLFKVPVQGKIFTGDLDYKKHLILVENIGECLIINIKVNHYPFDKRLHPREVARMV